MRAQDFMSQVLETNKHLLTRYLVGFDEETRTRQAPGLPNHVAWSLGHCAMTMHRVAQQFDGGAIPEADFIDNGARGDASRFGTETVAFASKPSDDPGLYPTLARGVKIYEAACDRLSAAVRGASDEQLARAVKFGKEEIPAGILTARVVFHNGIHTGQIADLRRALGMKSIFA